MFRLSNKQNKILKVAIPALMLLGLILYFALRKKPSNGKVGNFTASLTDYYKTEYALGSSQGELTVNFTTPTSAGSSENKLKSVILYTVPCKDGKCPPLEPNPVDTSDISEKYSGPFSPVPSTLNPLEVGGKNITGYFPINMGNLTNVDQVQFGIAYINDIGEIGDFVYLKTPISIKRKPGSVEFKSANF